mmetsp:Transcript_12768/g.54633  ORF Transcript_12768/g.54633 Transcript_12768/m.54633 type:complete len:355 (+) Transcript_12768:239-1303(+)
MEMSGLSSSLSLPSSFSAPNADATGSSSSSGSSSSRGGGEGARGGGGGIREDAARAKRSATTRARPRSDAPHEERLPAYDSAATRLWKNVALGRTIVCGVVGMRDAPVPSGNAFASAARRHAANEGIAAREVSSAKVCRLNRSSFFFFLSSSSFPKTTSSSSSSSSSNPVEEGAPTPRDCEGSSIDKMFDTPFVPIEKTERSSPPKELRDATCAIFKRLARAPGLSPALRAFSAARRACSSVFAASACTAVPAGLYAMALAKMSSSSCTNASQLWYLPSRTFSRSVRKSIGVETTEKYPGAIASVTGSANTPCLSFACSFLTTSYIAAGLGGGSANAGTGPGTKPLSVAAVPRE